jgi:hypothetical protein
MQPETLHDEVFGELTYDSPMEEWHAEVALSPDHVIDVSIWWDETDGPFPPVLGRARDALERFRQREPDHREALAAAMVERHRRSARPQEELPESNALARGLTAEQLSIAGDGSATVRYDDETELFGDHCIMVNLAADGSFIGFTLLG